MTQRIGASRTENRPHILRFSHIVPSWLLGGGIFVCLALIPIHVWAQQPVIRSIVPAQPAPGQVVTIQGHSLFSIGTTTIVMVQIPGDPLSSRDATVIPEPSNPNEVYVRLPADLPSGGNATLNLKVNNISATCSFDNTCSFPVALEPAAPIPLKICDTSLVGCPEISSAVVNDRIGIKAFGTDGTDGTDTSEVIAIFTQGATIATINEETESVGSIENATIGIVNEFIVPNNLATGPALVQLQVSESKPSFALRLMIQQQ